MNSFGTDITPEDIIDTLSFFDSWEERYKYIIDLGKELPQQPQDFHTEDKIIKGCQSKVWIAADQQGDQYYFDVDSDAHIVKGLLGVVLAAYNGKTAKEILAFDIEAFFGQLDLLKHLSPTRGNGLRSMVARIQEIASD